MSWKPSHSLTGYTMTEQRARHVARVVALCLVLVAVLSFIGGHYDEKWRLEAYYKRHPGLAEDVLGCKAEVTYVLDKSENVITFILPEGCILARRVP